MDISNQNQKTKSKLSSKIQISCKQNTTKFTDLSIECQLLTLEQLELEELINMAAVNDSFRMLVADVLKRRFGQLFVSLRRQMHATMEKTIEASKDGTLIIENYDLMLKFVKFLGYTVESLQVDFSNFDPNRISAISRYISKHCSDTLIQLDIRNYPRTSENVLDIIETAFKNAEEVSFGFERIGDSFLTLNELFPKVRRLNLENVRIINATFFNETLPHLEHISISFSTSDGIDQKGIAELIEKNPQIQSVQFKQSSYELLKLLSENQPNLHELKIHGTILNTNGDNGKIRFKNVKHFTIKSIDNTPEYLTFDQITNLTVEYSKQITDEWINFVVKQTHLIKIEVFSAISDRQVNMITENLRHFEDASINCASDVQVETINKFIQSNHNLKTFKLTKNFIPIISESQRAKWIKMFENDWNIQKITNGIFMKKKIAQKDEQAEFGKDTTQILKF